MSASRHVYLRTLPIPEARERVRQAMKQILPHPPQERVQVSQAAGRITAAAQYAQYSAPTYHSAAMDGVALRAEATFPAREGQPVTLQFAQDFVWINTGEPLPENMDAVVMIEHVQQLDQETISLEQPVFPWQHVRRMGEDIVATELLLAQNHVLSAYDLGVLLSAGVWEVDVLSRPHIHFMPTGDEILDYLQQPEPASGQVIESNSLVLGNLASSWGCNTSRETPVADNLEDLQQALQRALDSEADIIVISAGSSSGSRDYTRTLIEQFGQVLVHGIAAMPGKPSLVGIAQNKLIIGAPGYPVSAVVCFEQLVKPLLQDIWGLRPPPRPKAQVQLTRKVPSKLGQDEFLRLSIGRVQDKLVGTPLSRGAGLITSLCRAQGLGKIPADSEGLTAGSTLDVELLVSREELEKVLICVGSHDNILDLLANELMGLPEPIKLASTHLGSMGGISALKNTSTHIAGMHLFDPDSQDYNLPFLQKYLPDQDLLVVNLAVRQQGFILHRNNPKQIKGFQDLTRKDVRFINRQRGAGTRILLDHHLRQEGINPEQIQGYQQEEYTHMATAINVLNQAADCALGIYAAARALGLDFLPLTRERYDLVLPTAWRREPRIKMLLELLQNPDLHSKIEKLGGYETRLTGRIMEPGQGLQARD